RRSGLSPEWTRLGGEFTSPGCAAAGSGGADALPDLGPLLQALGGERGELVAADHARVERRQRVVAHRGGEQPGGGRRDAAHARAAAGAASWESTHCTAVSGWRPATGVTQPSIHISERPWGMTKAVSAARPGCRRTRSKSALVPIASTSSPRPKRATGSALNTFTPGRAAISSAWARWSVPSSSEFVSWSSAASAAETGWIGPGRNEIPCSG